MANTPWRRNSVKVEVDTGVEHTESATVPSVPGAGKGTYWVRSDSPTTPVFTDSAGVDHVISGDLSGPAGATDNALARFDGVTGKLVQNSVGTLSDTGVLSGLSNVLVAGAQVADAPADGNSLVIGNGSGDFGATIFTGTSGHGHLYFTDTSGSWQGSVYYSHTANALYIATAGAARMLINAGGFSPNTNNLYDMGTATFSWRSAYLTNTLYVPNVRTLDAAGSSASAAITVKPGLGGPTSGAGGSMTVEGGDAGGGSASGGGLFLRGGNPSGSGTPGRVLVIAADAVSGNVTGADVDIAAGAGSGTQPGGDVTILAGDNVGGSGNGGGIVITGGGCSSGTGGNVQIIGGNAGIGGQAGNVQIAGGSGSSTTTTPGVAAVLGGNAFAGSGLQGGFGQVSGGAGDGAGQGGHAQVQSGNGGASGNAGDVRLRSGSGLVNGRVTVEDMGVEFNELASMPGPAITAGNGRLWARNDAATALIFTDDTGAARPISKMQAVQMDPDAAYLPLSGAATSGPDTAGGQRCLNYSASSLNTAGWVITIPETYNGGNLTLRLYYTGTSGSTNNIRWSVQAERYVAGESMNSSHFATAVTCDAAGPATAEDLLIATYTLTNANLDGIAAGDLMRFEIRRLGADGGDTYAAVAELLGAQLREP